MENAIEKTNAHQQELVQKQVIDLPMNMRLQISTIQLQINSAYSLLQMPANITNEHDYLEHIVKEKIHLRYTDELNNNAVKERVQTELAIIKQLKFSAYFLIIQNIINWAKNEGIYIGPGHGSAPSSIVVYILGITEIDPLKYNLLFERFINTESLPIPSISILVSDKDEGRLVEFITTKYKQYLTRFTGYQPGLLEIDIFGLNKLPIIQDTIKAINKIPLNDEKTFELFRQGNTEGVFMFEAPEMQDYLRQLKPSCFEDLIAMNALYSISSLKNNIPKYIKGKNDPATINCYHKNLEPILMETYGTIVFQEQIMLIIHKLAGFSLGKANIARRCMAKKSEKELAKLRPEFFENGKKRGYSEPLLEQVWADLESCNWAYLKSHSVVHAYLAYQSAYLKAKQLTH